MLRGNSNRQRTSPKHIADIMRTFALHTRLGTVNLPWATARPTGRPTHDRGSFIIGNENCNSHRKSVLTPHP